MGHSQSLFEHTSQAESPHTALWSHRLDLQIQLD